MQSLASLLHGDRIVVKRSEHRVRFLHPKGWTYFDTLRQKDALERRGCISHGTQTHGLAGLRHCQRARIGLSRRIHGANR